MSDHIQALHAAISRRDWHSVEIAANALRDAAELSRRSANSAGGDWADDVTPEAVQIMRSAAAPYLAGADLEQVDPPPAVEAEPVAYKWRWLYTGGRTGSWNTCLERREGIPLTGDHAGMEVIPLYTRSSPVSAEVTVTDEMLAARDFIADVTSRADSLGIGMAKYPTAEIKLLLSALNGGRENG